MEKLGQINAVALELLEAFAFSSDIAIDYETTFDQSVIAKSFGLKLQEENKTLLEKLVSYINASVKLKKIELIILFHAKSVMTTSEIYALHKHCQYLGICLLLLESNKADMLIENEKKLIIDKDLCEILVGF